MFFTATLDILQPPSYNPAQHNYYAKNADEDEYASKRFPESLAEVVQARQKRGSGMDLRVVKRKLLETR